MDRLTDKRLIQEDIKSIIEDFHHNDDPKYNILAELITNYVGDVIIPCNPELGFSTELEGLSL